MLQYIAKLKLISIKTVLDTDEKFYYNIFKKKNWNKIIYRK
jgi:hypothetical protein